MAAKMKKKPANAPVARTIDLLTRDSSGKKRIDRAQCGDIVEDLRRLIHGRHGIDIYDLLDPNTQTIDVVVMHGNRQRRTFAALPWHSNLPRRHKTARIP